MPQSIKQRESLDSRYKDTELLLSADGKVFYDLWVPPPDIEVEQGTTVKHTLKFPGRLDTVAYKRLGNQRSWWMIAYLNAMRDQVEDSEVGSVINVPRRVVADRINQR